MDLNILSKLKCLSVFQIKILALVFMTIDHLARFELVPQGLREPMGILGRIAAPLFFCSLWYRDCTIREAKANIFFDCMLSEC